MKSVAIKTNFPPGLASDLEAPDEYCPSPDNDLQAETLAWILTQGDTDTRKSGMSVVMSSKLIPEGSTLQEVYQSPYNTYKVPIENYVEGSAYPDGESAIERTYLQFLGEPSWDVRDLWIEKDWMGVCRLAAC